MIAGFDSCNNSPYPGFRQTETGLYYKFYLQDKDGAKPEIGDILNVHIIYRLGDSVIFDSKNLDAPFRFPLDSSSFAGDIFEGLAMMSVGDSATFIICADSLKRFEELEDIQDGGMLFFDVKLIDFQKKADFDKEVKILKQQQAAYIQELKALEKQDIENYISNKIHYRKTPSGLYYMVRRIGYGVKPIAGNFVGINYIAYFLNSDTLYDSQKENNELVYFELGKNFEIRGIEEALMLMCEGSRAHLLVPSDLAYGEQGIEDLVPPCTPLLFDVELKVVMNKIQFEKLMKDKEQKEISQYVEANQISVLPDTYGMYFIELKKGTGPLVDKGKRVKVKYSGMLLSGKVFDNHGGKLLAFTAGQGEVIPGWELALSKMRAGSIVRLIIPSNLAYGDTYTGVIPPYTPLLFEIELLEVK